MTYLALSIPQGTGNSTVQMQPPVGVPQGGLSVITKVIGNSLTIMLIVAVLVTLIFLILGGAQWVTSGGDKSKVEGARKRITFAIVGLIVALGSFFIINIIGFFFNTNLLHIGN